VHQVCKKRINGILNLHRPNNNTDVCAFIGAVNHYKSLWPRRAHVLAPLTQLTGEGKFTWDDTKQRAFDKMKAILASADAINVYPGYTKPFHIYTVMPQTFNWGLQSSRMTVLLPTRARSSTRRNSTTPPRKRNFSRSSSRSAIIKKCCSGQRSLSTLITKT